MNFSVNFNDISVLFSFMVKKLVEINDRGRNDMRVIVGALFNTLDESINSEGVTTYVWKGIDQV